ncbi:DEAD/DEAH box helicase [Microbacterium sp. H1-D42]|uniref:DEAD/DEAH box helicase n=1 Tax=Microbacterium sp. H1-D42 TaxID=2925844 RepID=UPI001F533236|nr:DEAD/DEAH box helicase [Microbacterium sp. H1-D42]UNK72463.1 DEAD/DEAH box helicase [Microbacterium sp. H1-D42]
MRSPQPDVHTLRALAGSGGYQRGLDYARKGRVGKIRWDAAAQTLSADVFGSGRSPYRCRVRFDGARIMRADCSCPMVSDCKHVIAAILIGAEAERDLGAAGGSDAATRAPASSAPVDPPSAASSPPPRAAWEQFGALARTPTQPTWRSILTPPPTRGEQASLALGIEVRVRAESLHSRWGAAALKTATPRDLSGAHGEIMLVVRPLMRSASTGNWIQGEASWDSMRRTTGRFDPAQVRWFDDFLNIARDSLLSGTAGDWIALDRVESPLIWRHLDDLGRLGIPLIPTQKHTIAVIAAQASAGLRIDPLDTGDRGLSVAAAVEFDGEAVPVASLHPIGHVGLYRCEVVATTIQVTLGRVALPAAVHAAITTGRAIPVPEADREAFLRDLYPVLARQTTVQAPKALTLPALAVPEPVLRVAFRSEHRVEYRFEWEYAGHGIVPFAAASETFRDSDAEEQRARDIERIWSSVTSEAFQGHGRLEQIPAAEWSAHVLPAFEDSDVKVVTTGRRTKYRELAGTPEISVSTVESTDPDWFDMGILVKIAGHSIPFTPLFTALSMRRTKLLLVDGSYFSLAHPALQQLRDLIDEAAGLTEWETGPRISRYQTALWEDFEDLADEAEPAVSWRAIAEGLRGVEQVPTTPVPAGLHAQLRPYQQQGLDWLAFLWQHRLGGILADDMGLGKTLQLLSLIAHAKQHGEKRPFLVIAPTSVLATWRNEAARFTPGLDVRVVEGTATRRDMGIVDVAADADIVVTSYTLLRLDAEEYARVPWAGIIIDEAQFAKNPATKVHRAIADLEADVTIAVTGTPMENSLIDLWALFALTAPGLFASKRRFREEYVQPIEQGKVPDNEEGGEYRRRRLERLRHRIRPLMLRRTKDLVAAELPEKQVQEVFVELSPAHRAAYDTVLQRERQKVLGLLQDLDRNRFIVFRSLTMLRMLALSPALIDPEAPHVASGKLDVLLEHVSELRSEGHRALVFSQFTSFLGLAAERLRAAGIPYEYLDGSTRRREEVIASFRDGDAPVFLISLKAGGFGLTLTEADYVFLLDPWWNPAAEAQAIDRTHRIGQTQRVFVYRLIAAGTIEEKVLALQQRKARLFTAVMDDEALFSQALSADDIRGLLED